MPPKYKTRRLDLNACACTARFFARMSQYLLALITLSLLTMPITEHLWTWDHFFQTGRDFELGTIAVLSILLLVLVISKSNKQRVAVLLSARRFLVRKFDDFVGSAFSLTGGFWTLHGVPPPDAGTCTSSLPLKI